ncbi:MAG TPA: GNAT family N-acetyltransferase [Bryobacteraceae bacterium]|nr:GNAT family N-acetyltransferase [Bryobacteraceae bacterium]
MFFSDIVLARRLEGGEAESARECAEAMVRLWPASDGAVMAVGSGWAAFAGATSPLSHAVGLGMNEPMTVQEIERVEEFYRSRGAAATIDLCPLADPSLCGILAARGYHVAEFNNILVRRLDEGEPSPETECGVEVRETAESDATVWTDTLARGFFEGNEPGTEELEVGQILFRMRSGVCYLARVDGLPSGGGALAVRDRLAMLYADATHPFFRRRGVQVALIAARLRSAVERGCDLATAGTLPGTVSQRNYERLGFRVAYTRAVMVREWQQSHAG